MILQLVLLSPLVLFLMPRLLERLFGKRQQADQPFNPSDGPMLEPIPIAVSIGEGSRPFVIHVPRFQIPHLVNSLEGWDLQELVINRSGSRDMSPETIATSSPPVLPTPTPYLPTSTSSRPTKHESAAARMWAISHIRREILPHLPRRLQLGLLPMNKVQWEDVVAAMYYRIDPDDFQNYHARSSPLTESVYRGAVRVLDLSKIKQASWGGYHPVIPRSPLGTFPNLKKIIFDSHELTLVRAKPRPTFKVYYTLSLHLRDDIIKGVKKLPPSDHPWADIIPSQSCDVTVESPYWGSEWRSLTPGLKNRLKERLRSSSHYFTLDIRHLAIAAPLPLSFFTAYFDRKAGRTNATTGTVAAANSATAERRPPESLELQCSPYTLKEFSDFAKASGPYLKRLTLRTNPTLPLNMCLGDLLESFDWSVFSVLEECCIVVNQRIGTSTVFGGPCHINAISLAHTPGPLLRKITFVMQSSAQGSINAYHTSRNEVAIERCTSPFRYVSNNEDLILALVRRVLGEDREYHLKCWNFVR